jgi:hypothetical protein
MEKARPRTPIRKILWPLLAVVLICLGTMGIWISSVASRRHRQMEEQIRRLHAETVARVHVRPALDGETLEGSAWPAYSLALAEAARWTLQENRIRDIWLETPKADLHLFEKVVSQSGVLFDSLHQGARRSSGRPPIVWEDGWSLRSTPDNKDAELLGHIVAIAARLQAAKGDPAGAVLKLLDLLQFARDLAEDSNARCAQTSSHLWSIATLELKDVMFSKEFPLQELPRLDAALERLDRHLPDGGPLLLNETLRLGFELLKPEDQRMGQFSLSLRDCWRYGFSKRIAEADGFERTLADARRAAPLQDGSYAAQRADLEKTADPLNPLVLRAIDAGVFGSRSIMRWQRTVLHLLRVGVHYRATGEVLDLPDPYGDQLHHSLVGSHLKVWSVGGDGVDDGGDMGDYEWSRIKPKPVVGRATRPARDLVLHVER